MRAPEERAPDLDGSPDVPRQVHGRRRGRPLSRTRRGLVDEALPRLAIELPPSGGGVDPAGLFPERPEAFWLEIGFGSGGNLVTQAARQRDLGRFVGLIGAEYYLNGIAAMLRAACSEGVEERIRVYQGDGRDLLERLPAAMLERVFLLFPDPWPKARHHKRRFIQPGALDLLSRTMQDGAELYVATDDAGYLEEILFQIRRHPDFGWCVSSARDWRERPEAQTPTRYEQKALKAGRRPAYLLIRRRRRGTQIR